LPFFEFIGVEIVGIASAVPEQEILVDSMAGQFGETAISRIKKFTGVEKFRKASSTQTASDLGFVAARELLFRKNIDSRALGGIIFLSHSADYRRPATACVLHERLGMSRDSAAFDVNLGCSGYPYGLVQVASLMQSSDIDYALLICAETVTKLVSPMDRSSALLFGDAGTATLLKKTKSDSRLSGIVKTDGSGYRSIIAPAGGFRNRFASDKRSVWPDGNSRSLHDLYMDGPAVLEFTLTQVPAMLSEFLTETGSAIASYDSFVSHQANLHILKQIARKMKAPMEMFPISLDRFGNTSSASIPLTLCDYYGDTPLSHKRNVLMAGFGVGLSLGVVSAEIDASNIFPVYTSSESYDDGLIDSPEDLFRERK